MQHESTAHIQEALEPVVASEGYELVDSRFVTEGGRRTLRLSIDKPGGITLEDCEKVSHAVGDLIDVKNLVAGRYSLEVSSPGLDRPLRTPEHYMQFVGERVNVILDKPLDGRRNFKGDLLEYRMATAEIVIRIDGQDYVVPHGLVERANLVPVFDKDKERRK